MGFFQSIGALLALGGTIGVIKFSDNLGTEMGRQGAKELRNVAILSAALGLGFLYFTRKR